MWLKIVYKRGVAQLKYYAKSNPKETIMEHTNKLLENLKLLKNIYGKDIAKKELFDEERFWYLLEIICKYHDIGKVYTPFQNMILEKIKQQIIPTKFSNEIKHEQLSPMFIPAEKLELTENEKILVYQSIYYHHERKHEEIDKSYIRQIIEEDIQPKLKSIKEELRIDINEELNTRYIKYIKKRITEENELYNEYCMLKGLLHRLDHSSSGHLEVEEDNEQIISDCTTKFMNNNNFEKNKLQTFTSENRDKNILVIGSTGIGKTEAALLWSGNSKTFFTLPIRVSINAIFDRIRDNLKYKNVGLLHSTALDYLEEAQEFENEEEIYEQTKNLCYKITTCTIDQIFPFVFKYKGYEKIYSTLGYSKIIIDEVQAYAPEIVAIILKGIEKIHNLGGQFMIMTATLPRIYKDELEKMNIKFEYNEFIKPEKRHLIKLQNQEILENINDICQKGKMSKVLVIANTVDKAIEIYSKIKEQEDISVNLLHSRYILRDRNEKEKQIKNFSNSEENHGIWISTQIVEASLDIDFDYLYTEMSTLDSLFQRMGRCYRKREYKTKEPNIYIYIKNATGIGKNNVYNEQIHEKSIELLEKYNNQLLDEETKIKLVDRLYSKEMLEGTQFYKDFKSGIEVLDNIIDYDVDKSKAQNLLRNIANTTVIPKTIYDENIELFRQYCKCKDYKEKHKIRRMLNKLTVSIKVLPYSKRAQYIIKNPYMDKNEISIIDLPYDLERGLILNEDNDQNFDKRSF